MAKMIARTSCIYTTVSNINNITYESLLRSTWMTEWVAIHHCVIYSLFHAEFSLSYSSMFPVHLEIVILYVSDVVASSVLA